jgi:hypothetical protein
VIALFRLNYDRPWLSTPTMQPDRGSRVG